MSLNRFTFHGRLCKDVDVKEYKKGESNSKIATSDIAITSTRKNEKGEFATDFFTIKAFDKKADILAMMSKGKELLVSGSIKNHNYQNKEGKTVYTNEFIVDTIDFCGSKNDNGNANTTTVQSLTVDVPVVSANNTSSINVADDDLPF